MYRFVIKCIVSVFTKKEVSSTNVNLQKGLKKVPKWPKSPKINL